MIFSPRTLRHAAAICAAVIFALTASGCDKIQQLIGQPAASGAPQKNASATQNEQNLPTTPEEMLLHAAEAGDIATVQRLLAGGLGADATLEEGENFAPTALIAAAENGHLDIAKLLLEKGANANAIDAEGWTPLMFAAQNGHSEMAQLLLARGAEINERDDDGWNALMLAAHRGHTQTVRLLIEHKANVNAALPEGEENHTENAAGSGAEKR